MCVILFSYKNTPGYRLVLAANRDEFAERPTAPLAFWQDHKDVCAGIDLRAGGTWLGMHTDGRIGAITNFREPQGGEVRERSRGEVVARFLTRDSDPEAYLEKLRAAAQDYGGFNVLVGNRENLYCYSNRVEDIVQVQPGIHGLSNHLLNTSWPKVARGKKLLAEILDNSAFVAEDLFALLEDTARPPDEMLPDTGIGRTWERLLSSIFISSPGYGTRSSAVITIRDDGATQFRERTYLHDEGGWRCVGENCLSTNGS